MGAPLAQPKPARCDSMDRVNALDSGRACGTAFGVLPFSRYLFGSGLAMPTERLDLTWLCRSRGNHYRFTSLSRLRAFGYLGEEVYALIVV